MTQVLSSRLGTRFRQTSISSTAQQVIVPEAAEYEGTGSSDTARPWQGAWRKVRPQVTGELSVSFHEVDTDSLVILRTSGAIFLIDVGSADLPLWHAFRSSLASSAMEIRGMVEVRSYLDKHPDMFGVTEGICKAARREFGPEAFLTLRVYRDPEIEDEYLLLRVRLHSYTPDTMQRIRSVSDLHEKELSEKSGAIVVTTDFRPIR
jgi:hypothetical protein